MSLFELLFGLTTVILGLALTHIAAALQKLLHAGKRVRWAPEPLLLTSLVMLVIISVWIDQWLDRDAVSIVTWQVLLQVAKMLAIYFAAAGVLPDISPDGQAVDLYDHYDRTRRLNYGALIVGIVMFQTYAVAAQGQGIADTLTSTFRSLLLPIFLSLAFVRWRPYNFAALIFALIYYAHQVWSVQLEG